MLGNYLLKKNSSIIITFLNFTTHIILMHNYYNKHIEISIRYYIYYIYI